MKPKYSMVIPVYNEEDAVRTVLKNVKKALKKVKGRSEIIIVDDCSTDRSMKMVKQVRGVRIVKHKKNMGYGQSILDGVKAAKSNNIIIIDADGTYPAEEIPNLVKHIKDYDLISSARVGKNVSIPFIRRIGKFFHNGLISLLAGESIPDMNSGLRAFKRDTFLKYSHLYPSGFSISTTFLLCCLTNKHPVKFIPIDYFKRKGRSKIKTVRDGINFLILILRAITYFNPLRIFIPTSIAFFLGSLTIFSYYIIQEPGAGLPESVILLFITAVLIGLFGLIADVLSKLIMSLDRR